MSKRLRHSVIAAAIILIVGALVGLHLTGRLPARQPAATGTTRPERPVAAPAHPQRLKPAGLALHGHVEAAREHGVTAPRDSAVLALAAPEGQPVAQGQLLMQLDVPALREQLTHARQQLEHLRALEEKAGDPELRDRLKAAEAHATQAMGKQQQMQADLDAFQGQHPEAATLLDTFEVAQAEATSAALAFQNAVRELDRVQDVARRTDKPPAHVNAVVAAYQAAQQRNGAAQARFDQARAARQRLRQEIDQLNLLRRRVTSGRETVKQAQAELHRLRQAPEVAMIAQGRQRLEQANDRVANTERALAQLAVKAPVSGLLREIKVRPGQQVRAGQALAVVSEAGGARLLVLAGLKDAPRLAVGMRATVSVPDGGTFEATVSQIVPDQTALRVYLVPRAQAKLPPPGTALVAKS